ncbi:vanin-like protein 1 [Orussus abietinus]|uniref:vanin-like protein 1 n=1 Tax=Orussus abietinus TaxID=222816 RepID=UPI0006269F06|nr:vanin-like protein 1 [Orussus abietinus]
MMGANYWWCILFLIVKVLDSEQKSTPDSSNYIAAVVEYSPAYTNGNAESTLKENTNAYVQFINKAGVQNVDIIVFPEDGLTSVNLPAREHMDPWTTTIPINHVPCDDNINGVSDTLKSISCAAKKNQIYVVINIAEKLICEENDCPTDKVFYYNSNAVFDRTGKIISRYRKTHLFVESQFNVTAEPEVTTFDTDFDVRFGTFICFDILFDTPSLNITRSLGVTDIVYPTAWFSETPFLTAVQTQAGWSYAEDVNFMAAGYNRPKFGNAGSGIYLGRRGIGQAIFPTTDTSELLIVNVPKIKKSIYENLRTRREARKFNGQDKENYPVTQSNASKSRFWKRSMDEFLYLHDDLSTYTTDLLDTSRTHHEKSVCHDKFCCDFNVDIVAVDPNFKYRIVAFNGVRKYVVVEAAISVCSLVQCRNDSIVSCGEVGSSDTAFKSITITGTFENDKRVLVMPSTVGSDLLPLRDWTYEEHKHESHVHVTISLNVTTKNVVTFGLYSRNYKDDPKSNADSQHTKLFLVFSGSLIFYCRYLKTIW